MKIKAIFLASACMLSLCAQDAIIDTSKVLKDNQSVVVDARTNSINYILEIEPNGRIVKKYLTKREQESLQKALKLDSIKATNTSHYTPAHAQNSARKSHIKEWNKSKIIYEQREEWIRLKE